MILLVGGEKGGTGKTTIATNLATRLKLSGSDVLLIDTDKQGSASSWASMRDSEEKIISIPSVQKFGNSVYSAIKDLSSRYDDIVIDAGGRDSVELRASLSIANKIYIPLQASQFDVWTLGAMDKLVEQAKGLNPTLEAWVVINRASPNPSVGEAKEARGLFEDIEHINLSGVIIKDRIAYRKAARNGLAVFEMDNSDPKAVEEINNLYEEAFNESKTKTKAA